VVSSAVHAASDPMQHGHLVGDVPALLVVVAVVLGGLMMAEGRRRRV